MAIAICFLIIEIQIVEFILVRGVIVIPIIVFYLYRRRKSVFFGADMTVKIAIAEYACDR
jgi:hypothetical protein